MVYETRVVRGRTLACLSETASMHAVKLDPGHGQRAWSLAGTSNHPLMNSVAPFYQGKTTVNSNSRLPVSQLTQTAKRASTRFD
jgi:hypothetical protein